MGDQFNSHAHTCHALLTPEDRADEMMKQLWDNNLLDDHADRPVFTPEEQLALERAERSIRKVNETKQG